LRQVYQFIFLANVQFFPRNAMHKRGLCRPATCGVRLSVRLSVRHICLFRLIIKQTVPVYSAIKMHSSSGLGSIHSCVVNLCRSG